MIADLIVVPARFASTRLPGKPLLRLAGRTLLERVVENARAAAAELGDCQVLVATDDGRIAAHAEEIGVAVALTAADLDSGTVRAAAAAAQCTQRPARVINLQGDAPFVGVLAGARIEADRSWVRISREPGEAARGGLPTLDLEPGEAVVWDGRFELVAKAPGLAVRRLAGVAASLPASQLASLRQLPATCRGALPALVADGAVSCPLLEPDPRVEVRSLVGGRYRAAAGLIECEPD